MSAVGVIKDYLKFKRTGQPIGANYEITGNCTLRCYNGGCYFFKGGKPKYNDLSSKEWEKKFKEDKVAGIRSVILTGGEPMLRQDVIKMAYKIFNGQAKIVTNGTIKVPYEEGMPDNYGVSIEGYREINDQIRGKGAFDKVTKNIQDDKRVIIASTISEINKDQIFNLVRIAKETNVRGITFSLYTPTTKGDPLVLRGKSLDQVIEDIRKARIENPELVLVSDKMLEFFRNKKHAQDCYLRKGWIVSYDPEGKRKSPCVLGENVLCEECGCNIPVVMQSIREIDWKTFRIAMKIFSSKPKK